MNHRLLAGLALAPLPVAVLVAAAGSDAPKRHTASVALAASVNEPARHAADSVGVLAGGMVVTAGAAFAGTAVVRRRQGFRR